LERYDPAPARARVASEGWDAKASYLAEALVDLVYELEGGKAPADNAKRTAA
jgi:hypothetical protein